jgi:hypothetical protein
VKQIRVESWCDGFVRPHEHQTQAAIERTLTIENTEVVFDFCEDCADLLQQLRERGAEARQALSPVRRTRRPRNLPTVCPDCGQDSPTRSALGAHVKSHHQKLLRDYDWTPSAN